MKAVMAEMYGKREGSSRGRGGSMHIFDAAGRFYGGNAIVGGGLPLAVGLALADRLLARPNVAACFFGEGAVAEGEFHESINLAALWRLPVLFVCENNLYAMGTALALSESETAIAAKARSYRLEAEVVDLRTLCPLDRKTLTASVARTRRAVVVDEGWRSVGRSAEIMASLIESSFWELDAPIGRVCTAEVPIPYPKHLEEAALPQVPAILAAARAAVVAR